MPVNVIKDGFITLRSDDDSMSKVLKVGHSVKITDNVHMVNLSCPLHKTEQIEMKRGLDFNHFYINSFLRNLLFDYFMFISHIVLKSKHCPNA